MELRHLRYFVAVAEERHFARAATRLHIAQPPLSQQIRQLEAELGTPLLTRTTRKVELTPAGELLLERARRILTEVEGASVDVARAERGAVGRLAVGFTGSATYELLPSIAHALRSELPDVKLELHGEMLTPAQVEALTAGTLDVGLLRPPVRSPHLWVQVIRREPLVAVLPTGHPIAGERSLKLAKLASEPFIVYPSDFRSVIHDAVELACHKAGFEPQVAQQASETSTLVSLVAAGIGVALVPASVQHLRITGAIYRPLAGTTEEVALAVASRVDDPNPVLHQ
ncbi:MAG TPA: LysR substrate-binding domain-containing protein, partial [Acidimicrobiales bacterium]|nr:LysR substrate-binding domain-containing protein [Acidimicrobiales bacterium]